jgi:hypothetical protein
MKENRRVSTSIRSARRFAITTAILFASLAGLLLGEVSAQAQEVSKDMSGFWTRRGPAVESSSAPPLTEEGQRRFDYNRAGIVASDPEVDFILQCLPAGYPRSIQGRATFYLAQTEAVIVRVGGAGGVPQMIYMNDDHLNSWPLFMGDAIGHWEGGELVVEVRNVNTKTFMHDSGLPHSDELYVNERLTLIEDGRALQNEIRMEDPVIFTEPWEYTVIHERSDEKPAEVVCENQRLR